MKILELSQAATALRAFDWLGALDEIIPGLGGYRTAKGKAGWEELLGWIQSIQQMVELLNKENPSKSAQDYNDGLLCMKLGRFDTQLKERFASPIEPDFARIAYLNLAVILAAMCDGQPESQVDKIAVMMKFSRDGVRYFNQFASALKAWRCFAGSACRNFSLWIFSVFTKLGSWEQWMQFWLKLHGQAGRIPLSLKRKWKRAYNCWTAGGTIRMIGFLPRILVNGDELCTEVGNGAWSSIGHSTGSDHRVTGKWENTIA